MKKIVLFLFVFASTVGVAQKKNTKPDPIVACIDAICQKAIVDFNVPGMAVAIVKDGEVVLSKGYGVKSVNTKELVNDESLFAIASNSKAFTAAALAMLVDEGKLNWDDKVQKYMPEFQLYSPYVSAEMTIRDLLTHRCGLATFSGDLIWYGTTHSRAEVIRRARFLEPVFGFRDGYGYSNIMYLTAGEIVAKVSGMSWDDFVTTRILRPLGMKNATTTIRDFTSSTNLAMPHNEVMGKNVQIDYVNWDNIGPAGSINASVRELSQWIKLQLNKGKLNDKVYWNEARAYEMWTDENPRPVSSWQRQNQPSRHWSGYGLGWELMEYGGEKIVSHGGGYDGMISKTVLIPGKNIGFVILTNNINSLPSCLTLEILDAYLGVKPKQDWMGMFLGFKKEENDIAETPVPNTKPSLELSQYAGTYSSEVYGEVDVVEVGGKVSLDFKPTALFKGNLSHYHYDTFELSWTTQMMLPKGKVTFLLDAKGNVSEMKVEVPNPDFDFGELKLLKVK